MELQIFDTFFLQIPAQFCAHIHWDAITESAVSSGVTDKPRAELHLHTPFKLEVAIHTGRFTQEASVFLTKL
jgi:hypothetical protein